MRLAERLNQTGPSGQKLPFPLAVAAWRVDSGGIGRTITEFFGELASRDGWETVSSSKTGQRDTMMDHQINATTPSMVKQTLTLELVDATGQATPMQADLSYNPHDPYAVTAIFQTAAGEVCWTFGRDLLIDGLYEPSGDGDVHVWPCLDAHGHAVVIIELCSPDGEALVQVKTGDLTAFVERMTAVVPVGEEGRFIDLDAAISAIFASEAA